jgi:hypothetical protein
MTGNIEERVSCSSFLFALQSSRLSSGGACTNIEHGPSQHIGLRMGRINIVVDHFLWLGQNNSSFLDKFQWEDWAMAQPVRLSIVNGGGEAAIRKGNANKKGNAQMRQWKSQLKGLVNGGTRNLPRGSRKTGNHTNLVLYVPHPLPLGYSFAAAQLCARELGLPPGRWGEGTMGRKITICIPF